MPKTQLLEQEYENYNLPEFSRPIISEQMLNAPTEAKRMQATVEISNQLTRVNRGDLPAHLAQTPMQVFLHEIVNVFDSGYSPAIQRIGYLLADSIWAALIKLSKDSGVSLIQNQYDVRPYLEIVSANLNRIYALVSQGKVEEAVKLIADECITFNIMPNGRKVLSGIISENVYLHTHIFLVELEKQKFLDTDKLSDEFFSKLTDCVSKIQEFRTRRGVKELANLISTVSPRLDGDHLYMDLICLMYREFSRSSDQSLKDYESLTTTALSKARRADEYVPKLLESELNIKVPSFIFHPGAYEELSFDRNGSRVVLLSGDKLTITEKKALSAYRLANYLDPKIDRDQGKSNEERVPFFDWDTAFAHKMNMEDPAIAIPGTEYDLHVVIVDKDGRINGYVAIDKPPVLDRQLTFSDQREESQMYGLETVFGQDFLLTAFPELAEIPISSTIEIMRLIPRSNGDLDKIERIILSMELAMALTRTLELIERQNRSTVIFDTEKEKLQQIFNMLGIAPKFASAEPHPERLESPYNKLLVPRYKNREVSVTVFDVEVLNLPDLVERRKKYDAILYQLSQAKDLREKIELLSQINRSKDSTLVVEAPVVWKEKIRAQDTRIES